YSGSISLSIGTNPTSAVLGGITTVPAASGVATFGGLSINNSGASYTLTATGTGLTGATTNSIAVIPATPAQIEFTVGPEPEQAYATAVLSGTSVGPVTVVTGGDGFTTVPNVTISAPTGSNPVQATAVATLVGGVVTAISTTAISAITVI